MQLFKNQLGVVLFSYIAHTSLAGKPLLAKISNLENSPVTKLVGHNDPCSMGSLRACDVEHFAHQPLCLAVCEGQKILTCRKITEAAGMYTQEACTLQVMACNTGSISQFLISHTPSHHCQRKECCSEASARAYKIQRMSSVDLIRIDFVPVAFGPCVLSPGMQQHHTVAILQSSRPHCC
jgi:hypothetical protein